MRLQSICSIALGHAAQINVRRVHLYYIFQQWRDIIVEWLGTDFYAQGIIVADESQPGWCSGDAQFDDAPAARVAHDKLCCFDRVLSDGDRRPWRER